MSTICKRIREHLASLASTDIILSDEAATLRQLNRLVMSLSPADSSRFRLPAPGTIQFRPPADYPGHRIHVAIGCDIGQLPCKLEPDPDDDLFILAPTIADSWLLLAENDPAAWCRPMRVHLFANPKNFREKLCQAQAGWRRIFLWLTPRARSVNPELCREISEQLEIADALAANLATTVNRHYFRWVANEHRNLKRLFQRPHCLSFPENQPGLKVPAILIGAGPSLTRTLPLLKEIASRNQALLIAASTTLKLLAREEIRPHFTIIIEGRLQKHFDNLPAAYLSQIDLLVSLQTAPPHLDQPCRGLYWFHHHQAPTRELVSRIHPAARPLVAGGSVINNAFALASAWGCNPLILCGCDLAYAGKQKYTQGLERKDIEEEKDDLARKFFPVAGNGQNQLSAPPEFIGYAQDLELQIAFHLEQAPENRVYNLSPGGRQLAGAISRAPENILQEGVPGNTNNITLQKNEFMKLWQQPPQQNRTLLTAHLKRLKLLAASLETELKSAAKSGVNNSTIPENIRLQLKNFPEFYNPTTVNLIPWLFRIHKNLPRFSDLRQLNNYVKILADQT